MRDFPPNEDVETIDVCRPPQIEPRQFDDTLNLICDFTGFRIDSKPVWESVQLQNEAHEFQRRICELSGDESFSSPIVYCLNASEIRLEVPYESYMIYQKPRVIVLVQRDKVAGT